MGEKIYGIVGRQSLKGDPLLSTCQNCQLLGNHCTTMVAKPGLLSSSASRSTSSTQTCKHKFESNTYSDTDMHGPKSKFSATCLALGPAGWTHRCQVWCLRPGGLCKSVSDAPNSKQSLHSRHCWAKDGGKNLLNKPSGRHTASSFHVPYIHV